MDVKMLDSQFKAGKNSVALSESIWDQDYNRGLVHEAVVAFMANSRQASKKNKNRSEVRGGKAKPWRQKGTGNARAGGRTMPHWRGGGVAFAAHNANFTKKLNRKAYQAALKSALSEKLRDGSLHVIEALELDEPKTKAMIAKLGEFTQLKTLLIDVEINDNIYLAGRNIPLLSMMEIDDFRLIDLVAFKKVIITQAAVQRVEEMYADV